MEGQGTGGDQHSSAALVPAEERDHRGPSHGQREFHEAFGERNKIKVIKQLCGENRQQ